MSITETTRGAYHSLEKAEHFLTVGRAQKPAVSVELTKVYPPPPEGTPPIDWDFVQESNFRLQEAANKELSDAERAHNDTLAKSTDLRGERDDLSKSATFWLRELRGSALGRYGEGTLVLFALTKELSQRRPFAAVKRHVQDVNERLHDPDLVAQLGNPLPGQRPLDLAKVTEEADLWLAELNRVMAGIKEMRSALSESTARRQKALKHQRRVYRNVLGIQQRLYRLAGLDELVQWIRPPRQTRPVKTPETPTGELPDDEEPPPPTDEVPPPPTGEG